MLPGLIGQGLSFVAMLLPVAFSTHTAIVGLAVAAGIATGLGGFSTLAFPMTYPSIGDETAAATSLKASGMFLAGTSLVLLIAYAVSTVLGKGLPQLAGAGALLFSVGVDGAMISWLVRSNDPAGVAENRLKYGIINLCLTAPVALLWHWRWSLVASGCGVYWLSMAWILWTRRERAVPVLLSAYASATGDALRYMRANALHAFSYLLAGFYFVAVAVAIPELRTAAAAWAAVASICAGFGTVILQLVTPTVDSAVSAAVRTGDWRTVPRTVISCALLAGAIVILALPLSIGIAYVLHYFRNVSATRSMLVIVAAVLCWTTVLIQGAFLNTMSLLGLRRPRLIWDASRFIVLLASIVMLRGISAMVCLSALVAIWNGVYLTVVAMKVRDNARLSSPMATPSR